MMNVFAFVCKDKINEELFLDNLHAIADCYNFATGKSYTTSSC